MNRIWNANEQSQARASKSSILNSFCNENEQSQAQASKSSISTLVLYSKSPIPAPAKNAEGGQRTKNATFVKSLHYKPDRNFRGGRDQKKWKV